MHHIKDLIPQHPQRDKTFQVLKHTIKNVLSHERFANITITDKEIDVFALNLERGIFNYTLLNYTTSNEKHWNDTFKNHYIHKAVQINTNLNPFNHVQNDHLFKCLISREFNEFEICKLPSSEIYPKRWAEIMNIYSKEILKDLPVSIDINDREDGLFKCGKCKSWKTQDTQLQTRSGDEGTTSFCYCWNCGHRWRFNS